MKFSFSKDFVIDTSKQPFNREGLRISMLGGPGSGKSWNNSLIAEQFLSQSGTVVIFQPRDEYFTLKEKFDVVCVGGVHAVDMPFVLMKPKMYAKAVVEDGISMIFYTAGKDEEKLVSWVTRFIEHVLTLEETHHRPLLIILEEAQEYAPKSASGHSAPPWVFNRMIRVFKKCFTEGRKLNVIAIASSQRPQEVDFTIRQLANIKFFGLFSEQDIKYVDKECLAILRTKLGLDIRADKLLDLGEGEWLVVAGRKSKYIQVTHTRLTKHGAETPKLEYIAPRTSETKRTVSDLAAAIKEALKKEATEQTELEKLKRKNRDLEKKLEVAEEKARIKLAVKDMLKGDGDTEELAQKLAEANTQIKILKADLQEQDEWFKAATKDMERKMVAIDKITEGLSELLPSMRKASPSSSKIIHTETVPEIQHNVERPIVKTNEKTYEGRLLTLAMGIFFKEKKKIDEIYDEVTRVFGVQINKTVLGRTLPKLVQWKILQREKDAHKAWVYWLVPGAQERIKEASS